MQGWVTEPENINGYWLIHFPQCGENYDIATIPVKEEDLKVVRILDARANERIKAEHEKAVPKKTGAVKSVQETTIPVFIFHYIFIRPHAIPFFTLKGTGQYASPI